MENQIKAKEYAKKQREIITKGKIPSTKSKTGSETQQLTMVQTSRENLENDSPNIGSHTHTHIVNI